MDTQLVSLIAASIAFVGSHFAMSHPLRAPMVRMLGDNGFQGVYSLVTVATMVWIYLAFTALAPAAPLWGGFGDAVWVIASVLTFFSLVMIVGAARPANPAMALPGAEDAARAQPTGLFTMTRHPMMWGFALWALAHIIAAPTPRTLVVASAVLILALLGAHLQDRKKRHLMGAAWAEWESRTSFWPKWHRIGASGWTVWLIALVLWLAISWLHQPLGGWDAGLWRWL
jgi:uncharacterized membrane protein